MPPDFARIVKPAGMNRFSGIYVLVLSLAIWALSVWLLDAPRTAATESAVGPDGKVADSGSGASDTGGAGAASGAPSATDATLAAPTVAGQTAPREPVSPAGPASPRAGSVHSTDAGAAARDAAAPATPPASAGASQIALAPERPAGGVEHAGSGVARGSDVPGAGAPSTAGGPATVSRGPGTGTLQRHSPSAGAPAESAQPYPRFEYPVPPSMPQPPSGGRVSGGGAVASELDVARRAAWEGRLVDALARYRAAARIQPDSHVVWGEMGNVLWAMQRWPEAAYALEGAATLLVEAGELGAANSLVPAVGSIDPDAAQRVQRRVWAAAQRQPG